MNTSENKNKITNKIKRVVSTDRRDLNPILTPKTFRA